MLIRMFSEILPRKIRVKDIPELDGKAEDDEESGSDEEEEVEEDEAAEEEGESGAEAEVEPAS